MSKAKALNSTYMKYFSPGEVEPGEIRLVTFKGNEASIFYRTDYNTYIPNAINYIVGLFAYWNRRRTRPQTHVIISNRNLAKNIGCSYGHASYIMDQVEDIFKLQVTHKRGRSRAREVAMSSTLIDFMKVYTDERLEDFIIKHNIKPEHRFALQQVYRYLGWGIAPAQLKDPQLKLEHKSYMSDEERINYAHYANTSNQKVETRIEQIQKNRNLLSESQQKQFDNLRKAIKPGEKLIKYWFNILIKLQQIISWLTRDTEKAHDEQPTKTSVNNENLNEETSTAVVAATAAHQKKPDDGKTEGQRLQFMTQVIMSWNLRAERNNLPPVKRLTEERYNSLLTIMEEYKESEILQALSKIEHIHQGDYYSNKFTFKRFFTIETILYALEYDSNRIDAVEVDFMDDLSNSFNIRQAISTVPEFKSIKQVNTFIRQQNQ